MKKHKTHSKINTNTNEYTLLLTACVEPTQFASKVKRNDPLQRYEDYKQTLRKWLNHKDERIKYIIFAENSCYHLEEITMIAKQENKYNRGFIIFRKIANEVPKGIHYGYSELELIDELISRELIPTPFFIKATGRTYFPAISNLLDRLPSDYLFTADSRRVKFFGYRKNYILSNLFISNSSFYKKHIWGHRLNMNPGTITHFEQLLQKQIASLTHLERIKCILRFPINVDPQGYGAHWNINYQSPQKKLNSWFRSLVRKLFPNWYI